MGGDLERLARLWGTDKGTTRHSYTAPYATHLGPRRRTVTAVLEIGIGGYEDPHYGGQSLLMWRNYFPRAMVYGLDVFEKQLSVGSRIVIIRGDQSDPDSLARALAGCPRFDLIVDDGDHIGSHIVTAFAALFARLVPGGFYAIEDLQTAYDPDYGGGPAGTEGTALALVKDLIDELNLGTGRPIATLHAYPGLVLIEKSPLSASA